MKTTQAAHSGVAVREGALALARALGESAAFRAFEAAQEALEGDTDLRARLGAFQARDQELRMSQAWGGVDPAEVAALEQERDDLTKHPVFAAHIAALEQLINLLQEVAGGISEGVGLDYGAACAPAGGCCG